MKKNNFFLNHSKNGYFVTEPLFDHKELCNLREDLDEEFKEDEFNADWDFIENRIKAQIANSIWGKSAMYKVNLYMDIVAMDGLKQFPAALLLTE